ncbi:hypothetical protein ACLBWT_18990 [Paenibacillus sp. D51F]
MSNEQQLQAIIVGAPAQVVRGEYAGMTGVVYEADWTRKLIALSLDDGRGVRVPWGCVEQDGSEPVQVPSSQQPMTVEQMAEIVQRVDLLDEAYCDYDEGADIEDMHESLKHNRSLLAELQRLTESLQLASDALAIKTKHLDATARSNKRLTDEVQRQQGEIERLTAERDKWFAQAAESVSPGKGDPSLPIGSEGSVNGMGNKRESTQSILENMLGRKLSAKEESKVEWLEGWEKETVDVFRKIFREVHVNGMNKGVSASQVASRMFDQ